MLLEIEVRRRFIQERLAHNGIITFRKECELNVPSLRHFQKKQRVKAEPFFMALPLLIHASHDAVYFLQCKS
jgi:hypothetical protein